MPGTAAKVLVLPYMTPQSSCYGPQPLSRPLTWLLTQVAEAGAEPASSRRSTTSPSGHPAPARAGKESPSLGGIVARSPRRLVSRLRDTLGLSGNYVTGHRKYQMALLRSCSLLPYLLLGSEPRERSALRVEDTDSDKKQ